jgi:hypothetical protein
MSEARCMRFFKAAAKLNNKQIFELVGTAAGATVCIVTVATYGFIVTMIPGEHPTHASTSLKMMSTIITCSGAIALSRYAMGKIGSLIDCCTGGKTLLSCAYDYWTTANQEEKLQLIQTVTTDDGKVKEFDKVLREVRERYNALGEGVDTLFVIIDENQKTEESPTLSSRFGLDDDRIESGERVLSRSLG